MEIRDQEMKQILEIIQEEGLESSENIILMGDLNADGEESCIQRLREGNFLDSFHEKCEFTTYKIRGGVTYRRTIDYIFYRGDGLKLD